MSMNRWALTLVLLVGGCGGSGGGGGACSASPVVGSWSGTGTDVLTFGGDCQLTETACSLTATYPPVTGTTAHVLVTVTSSSGAASCLPVGQTECLYEIDGGTKLYLTCGGGTTRFDKQ